jgi:SAM-dependent methyltransferase
MFPGNDPEALRREYSSDALLRLRQETHEHYSVPRIDFPSWALERIAWHGDERILDVGAGHGIYYDRIRQRLPNARYYGLDSSPGMLAKHNAAGKVLEADAQQLPFASARFDLIMANHMLYHVPNVHQAIDEFRRVLKPDGVLLAATNSLQTMPEFNTLFRRAIMLLSEPGNVYTQPPMPVHTAFALENGARMLARFFYAVVRYDLPQALVFDSAEPAMAYIESWRPLREPQLPDEVIWEDVMLVMREQIARVIDHFGELVVNKISGILIATDSGGFIREFVHQSHHPNGQSQP